MQLVLAVQFCNDAHIVMTGSDPCDRATRRACMRSRVSLAIYSDLSSLHAGASTLVQDMSSTRSWAAITAYSRETREGGSVCLKCTMYAKGGGQCLMRVHDPSAVSIALILASQLLAMLLESTFVSCA